MLEVGELTVEDGRTAGARRGRWHGHDKLEVRRAVASRARA